MPAHLIHDLALILDALEARGRLVRVRSEVDLAHDLAGIAAQFEGGPRAVLFEKIKGHDQPVFTGLYWSRDLLGDLLAKPERELPAYVSSCIKNWQQRPIDPVVVERGPVLEVTEMGAIVLPPVPSFYAKPQTVDDIVNHTVGRALDLFDIDTDLVQRWGEDDGDGAKPVRLFRRGKERK